MHIVAILILRKITKILAYYVVISKNLTILDISLEFVYVIMISDTSRFEIIIKIMKVEYIVHSIIPEELKRNFRVQHHEAI